MRLEPNNAIAHVVKVWNLRTVEDYRVFNFTRVADNSPLADNGVTSDIRSVAQFCPLANYSRCGHVYGFWNINIAKNVHVVDKNEILESKTVEKALLDAQKEIEGQNGRILLRPSGTEPLIRLMVEGEDENECQKVAAMLEKAIISAEKEVQPE